MNNSNNDKEKGQEYYQLIHVPTEASRQVVLEANLSIPKNCTRSSHICSWKREQQLS
jgi:hypothetical protein